jgi:hypothetical protein
MFVFRYADIGGGRKIKKTCWFAFIPGFMPLGCGEVEL